MNTRLASLSPVRSMQVPLPEIVSPLAAISPRPSISHNGSEGHNVSERLVSMNVLVENIENAPTASSPDPTFAQGSSTIVKVGRFFFGSGSRNVTTRPNRTPSEHSIDLAEPVTPAVDERRLIQQRQDTELA
jgi:hypothetical protein